MDLSGNIINLCRICSAPGSHSIFAKIPAYLHENPRECAQWMLPIHRLVTEVCGLEITVDDGLPQKICVLCVSYLKHAYAFRRQTINNVAALLAAKYLLMVQEKQKDLKYFENVDIIPNMINPTVIPANMNDLSSNCPTSKRGRKSRSVASKKSKELLMLLGDSAPNNIKQNNVEEEQRRIEEAFSSVWQDSASDSNETGNASNVFSYTEKEFQEDDVMELDVLKENNISFNLPEDYKEKKCLSCRKRFMFDESYSNHLKECLLFKLVKFIQEVYHFLYLKENRSISSFEFIRRMVFSVKKMAEVISNYGEESVDSESEVATTVNGQTIDDEESRTESSFVINLEKLRINFSEADASMASNVPLLQQSDDGRSNFGSASISSLATKREEYSSLIESTTVRDSISIKAAALNNSKSVPHFPLPQITDSMRELDMIKNQFISGTSDLMSREIPLGGRSDEQRKRVSCKTCAKCFLTISELDHHRIRSCKRESPKQLTRDSPARERSRKNLNASYFHIMESLKQKK